MAVPSANDYLTTHSNEDSDAYCANFKVHKPGISKNELVRYYSVWAENGSYEKHLGPGRYNGPTIAADFVERFFKEKKKSTVIVDVAAGTGLVGVELSKKGFPVIDAIDPSEGMLAEARKKGVYRHLICEFLSEHQLPIDADTYDCAVISGGMGEGHIPSIGLLELIRIVKKGGLICIVMREEYLSYVKEYNALQKLMTKWEEERKWKLHSRTVVPRYSFDKNGVVFCYTKTDS